MYMYMYMYLYTMYMYTHTKGRICTACDERVSGCTCVYWVFSIKQLQTGMYMYIHVYI